MNETFMAGVQYNDLKGTSAADEQEINNIDKWLKDNNHIDSSDTLVGLSMHGHTSSVSVNFFTVNLKIDQTIPDLINSSSSGVPVKKINIDMKASEFIRLFKRFNVTLSSNSLMEGIEYDVQ